jgi:hypothetical protein
VWFIWKQLEVPLSVVPERHKYASTKTALKAAPKQNFYNESDSEKLPTVIANKYEYD